MKVRGDVPEFAWPAHFVYTYAAKALAWLLDGHAFFREALLRRWPGFVHRSLLLTERIVEIPFALRALDLPRGSRVLDLGAKASPLPLFLSAQGLRVVAVDLSPFPIQGAGPDFVLADMRSPPFRSDAFDAAAIVSTLEHVGVGFYDSKVDPEDDLALMDRLRALVRREGRVVLTVPYGRPEADRLQRVYDHARLRLVTSGWTIEREAYAIREGRTWRHATEAEAAQNRSVPETRAVAMLVLRPSG